MSITKSRRSDKPQKQTDSVNIARSENSAHRKGTALEQAVGSIETTILGHSANLSDKNYTMYFRKIIIVDGVKHEIDIWVEFDIGGGYKTVFIFECKNWNKRVGKDHIIVFSKKIEASKAAAGFFIAKNVSIYAKAASKLDRRMTILRVTEDLLNSDLVNNFHHVVRDMSKAVSKVNFFTTVPPTHPLDMNASIVTVDEIRIPCKDYINKLIEQTINEDVNKLPTHTFDDGFYKYDVTREITELPNRIEVDGMELKKIVLTTSYQIEVLRPKILSKYLIESRGRVYNFEAVSIADAGSIQLTLVEAFP